MISYNISQIFNKPSIIACKRVLYFHCISNRIMWSLEYVKD